MVAVVAPDAGEAAFEVATVQELGGTPLARPGHSPEPDHPTTGRSLLKGVHRTALSGPPGSPARVVNKWNQQLKNRPQLTTTSRLLKLGEEIEFHFWLPDGVDSSHLRIYPRYLEKAEPGKGYLTGGDLAWMDAMDSESIPLKFEEGRATATYKPTRPGNYLAKWNSGGEVFCRYFAAIEDDWIVLRFTNFYEPEADPTLHGTGIPLVYRLPIKQFTPEDPFYQKFLSYHRHFGDAVVPMLPMTLNADDRELTQDERVKRYAQML